MVEEGAQLQDADPEVGLVEFVGRVPADGPELPSLLNGGVEEAKGVEELLEDLRLVRGLEEFEVAYGIAHVGLDDVGAQALWRLVRYLN